MLALSDWPDSYGSEENVRPRRNAWANCACGRETSTSGLVLWAGSIRLLHVLFFLPEDR
jgi:hypothetical protein